MSLHLANYNAIKLLVTTAWLAIGFASVRTVGASDDAKRLYDDLLKDYNKMIRPVQNNTDRLAVEMRLRLSQLIDVDEKNQIMTVNVWVQQRWHDYKLSWDPANYGGVSELHVPADRIWLPDIILYNNADGNYQITLMTKATLNPDGTVVWEPPAIYKSSCPINVEFFPFDEQECSMKFGSWSYDGFQLDLKHICAENNSRLVYYGMDLRTFAPSVEWDVLGVPAVRNERYYPCCVEPFPDIVFNITIRRKTLFYTVNLIVPCVAISFLTVLVFYLPSDSGEKVTLCISILLSLTVFFLLLAEIIPPTSMAIPLIGKYILFTMVLVTLSIFVTVAVLNIHFGRVTNMPRWVRSLCIDILPPLLAMKKPVLDFGQAHYKYSMEYQDGNWMCVKAESSSPPPRSPRNSTIFYEQVFAQLQRCDSPARTTDHMDNVDEGIADGGDPYVFQRHRRSKKQQSTMYDNHLSPPGFHGPNLMLPESFQLRRPSRDLTDWHFHEPLRGERGNLQRVKKRRVMRVINRAIASINHIADHIKEGEDFNDYVQEWKYVAMVLDRLFLWIFTISCVIGTVSILFSSPLFYDTRPPLYMNETFTGECYEADFLLNQNKS